MPNVVKNGPSPAKTLQPVVHLTSQFRIAFALPWQRVQGPWWNSSATQLDPYLAGTFA
jgi:hypothetical protein